MPSSAVETVCNLKVHGVHTFRVGDVGMLVHNDNNLLPPVSRISESSKLVREAERRGRSFQRSLDHLTYELRRGNLNPGIGTRPIGCGLSEARTVDGARVYFRQRADKTIEILGKSSKENQSVVIEEVLRRFGG